MKKTILGALVAASLVAGPTVASAAQITGSFPLAGIGVSQDGANLAVSNTITAADSMTTDVGMGDYSPIPGGALFGPLAIDLTNPAGGFGLSLFNATYGGFAAVSGVIVHRTPSFIDLYVLGTYTPGLGLPGLDPSPTSLRFSINQSGQSVSAAITLNSPPIPIPEPVSLLLLGTGLIGLGIRRRR